MNSGIRVRESISTACVVFRCAMTLTEGRSMDRDPGQLNTRRGSDGKLAGLMLGAAGLAMKQIQSFASQPGVRSARAASVELPREVGRWGLAAADLEQRFCPKRTTGTARSTRRLTGEH